jgi:hypothetical protein
MDITLTEDEAFVVRAQLEALLDAGDDGEPEYRRGCALASNVLEKLRGVEPLDADEA